MTQKQRTPRRNVKRYLREKLPVQAADLDALARSVVDEYGGSIVVTRSLLGREYRGQNFFKTRDESGVITYHPKQVRKTKARFPKKSPRSRNVNVLRTKTALSGAEA